MKNVNELLMDASFKLGCVDTGVTDVRLIETVEMLIEVIRKQQTIIEELKKRTDGN